MDYLDQADYEERIFICASFDRFEFIGSDPVPPLPDDEPDFD